MTNMEKDQLSAEIGMTIPDEYEALKEFKNNCEKVLTNNK